MNTLEVSAAAFGLVSVALTVKRHIACWPTGVVMVLLYAIVFYQAQLYGNMLLQGVYFALCIYGWYHWSGGGTEGDQAPIRRQALLTYLGWFVGGVAATMVAGRIGSATGAASPYWDGAVTVFSLIAQWHLSRKDIGSWPFWILVDVMAVGLFLSQELFVTAALYFAFLCLATTGLFTWRKALAAQEGAPA